MSPACAPDQHDATIVGTQLVPRAFASEVTGRERPAKRVLLVAGACSALTGHVAALVEPQADLLVIDRDTLRTTVLHGANLVLVECGPPHATSLALCASVVSEISVPVLAIVHGLGEANLPLARKYAVLAAHVVICCQCPSDCCPKSPDSDDFCRPCLTNSLLYPLDYLLNQPDEAPRVYDPPTSDVAIDFRGHRIYCADSPVHLTPIEFGVLAYLNENAGQVVTKDELLRRVWGGEYAGAQNIVEVAVRRLRQKLQASRAESPITTVYGEGYRLDDPLRIVGGQPGKSAPADHN